MESPTSPPLSPAADAAAQPQPAAGGGKAAPGASCKGCWVEAAYSVYVGNLDPDTSVHDMEELLYELFLQVSDHMLQCLVCVD